jgi:methyl-accepting chemotaxis protein
MQRSDVKLGTRLGAAFLALVLLTAGLGAFAVDQLARVDAHLEMIARDNLPGVELVGRLRFTANRLRRAEADQVLAADAAQRAAVAQRFDELRGTLAAQQTAYEALVSSGEERQAYERYSQHRDAYVVALGQSLALARGGSFEAARTFYREQSASAFDAMADDLTRLCDLNVAAAAAAHRAAQATYASARGWTVGLVAAACALALGLALLIVRSVTRQLGGEPAEAAALARQVAAGELGAAVRLRPGDGSSLMAQLKTMQDSLAQVVAGVRHNADSVATASAQIAQGNNDLSARTEEQASALEQTAASMEQLGATVRQNADSARQANQLALGASAVAARGGAVVGDVVQTMQGINDSSRRIADIIGVIDGIAFQTNILALNAAVEAARAGEQGRGFAVVATEVRNLAQRSAGAAREIRSLIQTSVERVERGTVLVDRAGATMGEIVSSTCRVADIVGEISAASAEQSAGVAQVCDAVAQMDRATQQNAALVEESAAAAESLRHQAHQLVSAVAVFRC